MSGINGRLAAIERQLRQQPPQRCAVCRVMIVDVGPGEGLPPLPPCEWTGGPCASHRVEFIAVRRLIAVRPDGV